MLPCQGLLSVEASWQKVLAFLPDETLRADLHTSWAAKGQTDGPEVNVLRWQQLEQEVAKVHAGPEASRSCQSYRSGCSWELNALQLQTSKPMS